ncbi:hypothetical protein CSB37_02860 [bacterium DOLZORAL124_38_8]|nr:MAG: hypothetical protein CSB37_02860 [bacterium DOLZORAL124_38_8]
MKNIFCISVLMLVPILAWGYFFFQQHKSNYHFLITTFFAGMLSIIPIKIYERYWDKGIFYLEHLNLFKYLDSIVLGHSGSELLVFLFASLIVSLGIFGFCFLLMSFFEIMSGDNSLQVFEKKAKKIIEAPFLFVSIGVLIGLMAFALNSVFPETIWFFIMVGILEEFVKHLIMRFCDDEKIQCVADSIQYSIVIALGFSFVENIIYFQKYLEIHHSFTQIGLFFVLRSLVPVLGHVCFSAILGYFYGIAHFSDQIYGTSVQARKQHPIIEFFHKLLHVKGATLFHEEKLMEGLIVAMLIHALFNYALEQGNLSFVLPMLAVLLTTVLHLLHSRFNRQNAGRLFNYIS